MTARTWIVIAALLCAFKASDSDAAEGIALSHFEPLADLSVRQAALSLRAGTAEVGPADLEFQAFGRAFALELEPNAGLLSAMAANDIDSAVMPYRGTIKGVAGSWASITVVDGAPTGLIWDGSDLYAMESPGDSFLPISTTVMYRLADAVIAPGALRCASGSAGTTGAEMFSSTVGSLRTALATAPGAIEEINIGAVGDFEFSHVRSDPEGAIITRLNNVDVIFSEQVGVQINVPFIDTYATDTDDFTATTDPGELLPQVASYRTSTLEQRSQGLTHLYTGRDLDGSTVGIAYTGALCDDFYGAGLSEGNGGPNFDSLVAAHEIGHNFGAPHDGEAGSPCEAETGEYIMAATLNNSNQFSACSIAEMQPYIDLARGRCINPLPSTDIAIEYNGDPAVVLLSNAATITFDVVNNGTQMASGIVADITLPTNVSLVAASGSTATCVAGATNTVNCDLANLAGGSAATLTVSATTIATGLGTFSTSISAAADDNPGNNTAAAPLRVDPAVELVANAPLPAEVVVDQSTTVAVILDNDSTLAATGVTVGVTLGAGLRASSASWPPGICTVSDQQVDCAAAGFDAQSTSTLRLGVTGATRGTHSLTVTVASTEADADSANNSTTGSVRVTAAANGNDDEGGGSFGILFLASLGLLAARRRFLA